MGFSFYDLIFPLFIFMVGTSLVFSLAKVAGNKPAAFKRIALRFLSLFLLGILYNGGFSRAWPDMRLMGVLQRIALCYLAASLLFLYCSPRTLAIVAASILLAYWVAMELIPVPGHGRGDLLQGHNLADYLDQRLIPGRLHGGQPRARGPPGHPPGDRGLACWASSRGLLLRGPSAPWKKVVILLLAGSLGVAVGMAWGGMFPELAFLKPLQFPVIKKIWTSSYVLVARWVVRDFAGSVLLGHRRLEAPDLGDAIRLDRDERDHAVPRAQLLRFRQARGPTRRRRRRPRHRP